MSFFLKIVKNRLHRKIGKVYRQFTEKEIQMAFNLCMKRLLPLREMQLKLLYVGTIFCLSDGKNSAILII